MLLGYSGLVCFVEILLTFLKLVRVRIILVKLWYEWIFILLIN